MLTHFFVDFIDAVAKTLGLSSPTGSTEKDGEDDEDSKDLSSSDDPAKFNQYDYLPKINSIRDRLHTGCNLSSNITSNHLDILEHVCRALIRKEIILQENIYDTYIIYIKNALIPLMCADISIFKDQATEESIYFHLDRILKMENVVTQDGELGVFRKRTAYKYMLDYIGNCFAPDMDASRSACLRVADDFIHELLVFLEGLPRVKKGNQTCKRLNEIINDCTKRLPSNNVEKHTSIINSISAAYTAVIILQDIDNVKGMFYHFHNTYVQLAHGSNHLLNNLKNALKYALECNYRLPNEEVELLSESLELPPLLLLREMKIKQIDNVIDCITPLFGEASICTYKEEFSLVRLREELSDLSQMVYPPSPSYFYRLKIDNDGDIYYENHLNTDFYSTNSIVFDINKFTAITELANNKNNRYQNYFSQYAPLLELLDSIQKELPDEALNVINQLHEVDFSLFGFNKYALAVLAIGLMYNQRIDVIKNISLLPQVNHTINHQGNILIPAYRSCHLGSSWLKDDVYITHSIIFGINNYSQYNAFLARALYCYNFTIARHTTPRDLLTGELNHDFLSVDLKNLDYSSQLISHDILDDLNKICGKILAGLDKVSTDVNLEDPNAILKFVNQLVSKKVIARSELKKNLIHCVTGSYLAVCLLDYLSIVLLFAVPGDNVKNIIKLGEKTNIVELLFKAHIASLPSGSKNKKRK